MSDSKELGKEWILPAEYYNKKLYPVQDKVFSAFKDSPFYLTGGTALSRGYYNHRFSDDLDYFLNYHPDFNRLAQIQIDKLLKIFTKEVDVDYKGENYYRIFIDKLKLKIEMVNDVPSHIGKLLKHQVLGVIDSKENILANKLTAITDRCLPKDIVDIYFLLKDGLDIKKALVHAESKAAGIAPLLIAKIFYEFDYSLINKEIKWIESVSEEKIRKYLQDLSLKIVKGKL